MIKLSLESEVEITKDENMEILGNPIRLKYYLIESEIEEIKEVLGKKVFGIEIVKKMGGEKDECATYRDLLCCRDSAMELLNKLAANTVTPIGLQYVLDDVIGI